MKHKTAKTVASALVLTVGLTMVPAPAFAVSSNIVSETEGKTTLTVSQIQDLAVIYNDTVDVLDLQMKQLELQEQMARNSRRSLQNQINGLDSSAVSGSGDTATMIAALEAQIAAQTAIANDTTREESVRAAAQAELMRLTPDLIALKSAQASMQSASAQIDSAYDQLADGIDQINDGLDDLATGKEDLQQAMKDLESQMRYSSAYQALAIVQLESGLEVMEKNLELVNKSIEIYELQEQLGMTTTLNVDTQRVSKIELEKSIADSKETLDNLKRSLNRTIGREASMPLEVVPMSLAGIMIEPAPEYNGTLVQKFVDNDKTLETLNRDRTDLKDSVESDMGSDEKQQIDYNVQGVDKQIKDQRQAVADNVKAMLAKINSDGEAFKISRQKYVNEKQSFEITQKKYELGMISQLQLLQAEASLMQAEMTNLQNGYTYYFDWQKYNLAKNGIDTSMLP